MYMDAPPDNTPPAAIGHNSRSAEAQKATKDSAEAKAQYLRDNLGEGVSNKVKILYAASISSTISSEAFRQLFVTLAFANRNCDNITVGLKRVGMLLDRSDRSIQRVAKELEEHGWLSEPKRQGRAPSVRSAAIPEKALKAIIFEVLDMTNLSGRNDVPDLALRKFDTPEVADRCDSSRISNGQTPSNRYAKTGGITLVDNLGCSSVVIAPSANTPDPENLVAFDMVNFQNLVNSWGAKPSDQGLRPKWPRSTTDPTLTGAVNAEIASHPRKIVILAARTTILTMQSRAAFTDDAGHGLRGFGTYFCKALHGTILDLLKREREALQPSQTARGSPPGQKHWREVAQDKSKRITEELRLASERFDNETKGRS